MNEKYAHLIGLLLSDGSVYYDKSKKTYCIQFTNKSSKLREIFKDLMSECFGVKRFYEIPCRNAVSVRVFSKQIANNLFHFSPTFRTLPCNSFPQCNGFSCISCSPKRFEDIDYPPSQIDDSVFSKPEYIRSFLMGFVSGDGGIVVNKKHGIYTIEICCYHPFLKQEIIDCLSLLGFQARSKKKAVLVSGIDQFTRFIDEIHVVK